MSTTATLRHIQHHDSKQIAKVVEILQGKWTPEILCAIRNGPIRLSHLKRLTPQASKKALTAKLRLLQDAGIIERRDLSNSVLHVEYELVGMMREPVTSLLNYLSEWASLLPPDED